MRVCNLELGTVAPNPIATLYPFFFVTSGSVCHLSRDHTISYLRARTLALPHHTLLKNNTAMQDEYQDGRMGSTGREQ